MKESLGAPLKAGTLVVNEAGMVLIATSAGGHKWILPKGFIDPGETRIKAVLQ